MVDQSPVFCNRTISISQIIQDTWDRLRCQLSCPNPFPVFSARPTPLSTESLDFLFFHLPRSISIPTFTWTQRFTFQASEIIWEMPSFLFCPRFSVSRNVWWNEANETDEGRSLENGKIEYLAGRGGKRQHRKRVSVHAQCELRALAFHQKCSRVRLAVNGKDN